MRYKITNWNGRRKNAVFEFSIEMTLLEHFDLGRIYREEMLLNFKYQGIIKVAIISK